MSKQVSNYNIIGLSSSKPRFQEDEHYFMKAPGLFQYIFLWFLFISFLSFSLFIYIILLPVCAVVGIIIALVFKEVQLMLKKLL